MKEKLFSFVVLILLATVSGCSEKSVNSQLQFALWYQGNPLDCQRQEIEGQFWQLDTLAFYMSETVLMVGNQTHPVKFFADEPGLQLIRFDSESCKGQVTMNSTLHVAEADSLRFTLGVPFALNHKNPVTQPMPLNFPDMFWTWRNGYKFLRIDMHSANDNWAYHLGSVGCLSASAVRAPEQACSKPNRVDFELLIPKEQAPLLVLHLDRLLADTTPTATERCVMHGNKEPACETLFDNLNSKAVSVFTLESMP